MRVPTRVLSWLIDRLYRKERGPVDFHTIDKECFGVGWDDDFPEIHGYPTHICFRGETYVPIKPSLRVRTRNHLVGILNERHPEGVRR